MVTDEEYRAEALELFPVLEVEFKEFEGLLQLQMGAFENKVTQAIRDRNDELVKKSFFLAEKCFRQGNENMKDAVDVSFVEGVLVMLDKESKEWGWSKMPHILKELYLKFWGKFKS